MNIVTLRRSGRYSLGVKLEDYIVDIGKALEEKPQEQVPTDVMDVIRGGEQALRSLEAYIQKARQSDLGDALVKVSEAEFGPCLASPGKIICVGLNYRKHAEETNAPIPQYPILFNKFNNALAGHWEDIPLPTRVSVQADYEAELVIVIGKQTKYVPKEEALAHVFGYCNANDISARDLQLRTPQWLLGKSCDKFSPLGPYLVTADEVGDPNNLSIRCIVNGEVRQNSNTSDMIFRVDEIVSYISQHMTLYPGDIILTGTPEGVVLGYPEEERVYLKPGDVVTVEIEKLGALTNRMVDENAD